MPDYSKGKIYKILNTNDDEVYVGSTVNALSRRMAHHRHEVILNSNQVIHQHMKKHGVATFYIELIEAYPCLSVEELRAREGEWIRQVGTLNKRVAGRSKSEYYEQNREKHAQRCKDYNAKHRGEIYEYNKIYYSQKKAEILERMNERNTCECGGEYTRCHKARHLRTLKHLNYIKDKNLNIEDDGSTEGETSEGSLSQ